MKKYEILARASSVGRMEDREGLNPDLMRVTSSARASPSPVAMQMAVSEVDQGQVSGLQVNSFILPYKNSITFSVVLLPRITKSKFSHKTWRFLARKLKIDNLLFTYSKAQANLRLLDSRQTLLPPPKL